MSGNETTSNMMAMAWGAVSVHILAALIILFMGVAAIGNFLVMISILATRKQCDRGYIFLFNLSLVDFLTAVCVMPIAFTTLINGDFIFSPPVCEFNGYTTQLFFIASIHTLMYMAVYRYMSISNPFSPVHLWKICVMIAASWLSALSISALSAGVLSHFQYKPFTTQCGPSYPIDIRGYINVAIIAGLCFILPLVVVLCSYIVLFRKANNLFKRLGDPEYSNYSHEAHAEQRHTTNTFIIIVVGFIICWTPIFVYLNYASLASDKSTIPTLLNPIVYWFSYFNSAINPFIYGFRTPIFKRLRTLICSCVTTNPSSSHSWSIQNLEHDGAKAKSISSDVSGVIVNVVYPIKTGNNNGLEESKDQLNT